MSQVKKRKKGKSYNYDCFLWSEKEYGLQDLLDRFGYRIPFLIIITQGYMGRDEWLHGLASDDVFWLYDIIKQPRVVVKDSGNYYSVPFNYADKIIPSRSNGIDGPPMTIQEMVEDGGFRLFRFQKTERRSADEGDSVLFGCMEIMDTYDERFMVAHTLLPGGHSKSKDGMLPEFAVIPVYMPIAVALAVGMVKGSERKFYKTMIGFQNSAENCKHKYDKILREVSEIMVFDEKPTGGDYEYIHFLQFIKTNKEIENISPEGYWQVQDKDVSAHPPQTPLRPSDKPPVRPPRTLSDDEPNSESKKTGKLTMTKRLKRIFTPAAVKTKGSKEPIKVPERTTPGVGKGCAPSPPPGCSSHIESDSDDSFDYEDVTEVFGVQQTPWKERVGPVAFGIDVEDVLPKIHEILQEGVVPPLHSSDVEDDCISTEEEEEPPYIPEPLSERPLLPKRSPYENRDAASAYPDSCPPTSPKHMQHPNVNTRPSVPQRKPSENIPSTAAIGRLFPHENPTQVKTSQVMPAHSLREPSKSITSPSERIGNVKIDSLRNVPPPKPTQKPSQYPPDQFTPDVVVSPVSLLEAKSSLQKTTKSPIIASKDASYIPKQVSKTLVSPVAGIPPMVNPQSPPHTTEALHHVSPMSKVRAAPLAPIPQEPRQAIVRPNVRPKPNKERLSQILIEKNLSKPQLQSTPMPVVEDTKPKISMSDVAKTCDVPTDISNFSVEDISKCLTLLHLSDYVSDFADLEIDGDMISTFDEDLLKDQFCFSALDSKILIKFIHGWRPKMK